MIKAIVCALAVLTAVGIGIAAVQLHNETPVVAVKSSANSVQADLMLSRPCPKSEPCVQTWTLTSRLGHILEMYEARLGPRNPSYRILGVEFTTTGRPRTWYPDFGTGARSIIVQLTQHARQDLPLAMFQLGHEAFHLIEPIKPDGKGSFFEEGLASYFAIEYLRRQKIPVSEAFLSEKSYQKAYELTAKLVAQHSDFYARLKRFRKEHGSFSNIREEAVQAAFPNVSAAVARRLAEPFHPGTASSNR